MKKVTLILFMLAMGITNAQTFDFSCTAPPIPPENPFTEAQADRLEAAGFLQVVRIARENGIEFEQIFYQKNYDNNARTVYTITADLTGYTVRYFDSRPENDYNTYSANTVSGNEIITRMLRDQPQMENWINSDQRATLYNAGFRWDASIDAMTGQRFHFRGHWSGELWLRSNYNGNYQAFLHGVTSNSGNINTQIDKAIAMSVSVQGPFEAAIYNIVGQIADLDTDFKLVYDGADDAPNRYLIKRKSANYRVGFIYLEDGNNIQYRIHDANNNAYSPELRFNTAEDAFRGAVNTHSREVAGFGYTPGQVELLTASNYSFQSGVWFQPGRTNSVQYLPFTNEWAIVRDGVSSTFDSGIIAVDYLRSGQLGVPGFTGAQKASLEASGWVYDNVRFSKAGRNKVRIQYVDGVYRVYVWFRPEHYQWGGFKPLGSFQEAIEFANRELDRALTNG